MLGWSSDIGDPFGNGSVVLAVSVTGEDVVGEIYTLPWKLSQAGVVKLYRVDTNGEMNLIARYDIARRFARFGSLVLVSMHITRKANSVQWWFVYPDTFVPGRFFRINKFSGLLNRPLVRTWKLVPTVFVRTSEISGLSEPGLMNHHCI